MDIGDEPCTLRLGDKHPKPHYAPAQTHRTQVCLWGDLPGENGELGLDHLDTDDDQQEGANDEDHELEEGL